jgi:uncharacterized repeat protein (TIGR03803 family)
MKKQILTLLTALISLCAGAQPVLFGATQYSEVNPSAGGGPGAIISYLAGSNTVSGTKDFPVDGVYDFGPSSITLTETPDGAMYGLRSHGGVNSAGSLYLYLYTYDTIIEMISLDSLTGRYPYGSLLLASDGLLYGLTSAGGAFNGGTIFSFNLTTFAFNLINSLPANATPLGSLMQASNGKLYGETQYDGTYGGGTIFEYDPVSTVMQVRCSLPLSASPQGGLLEAGTDTLYGLGFYDGNDFGGTLFRYVIGDTLSTVMVNLDSAYNPIGTLMRATDGKLYGTTTVNANDGLYGKGGTLFSYVIGSDSVTVVHNFGGNTGDQTPGDVMQASDGMIYGTTGGDIGANVVASGIDSLGTIFQYNPNNGVFTTMVNLSVATGYSPLLGHLTEYVGPAGIASVNSNKFNLYPNPTNGSFMITNNYSGALSVQVVSLLGERLKTYSMTGSQQSFDISDLAVGIYEVQISDDKQTLKVMKVVKE